MHGRLPTRGLASRVGRLIRLLLAEDDVVDGVVILMVLPVTSTTASRPVVEWPGGRDEELVGGLVEGGGEAGHRVVPEMPIVDESAKQLGHHDDVVLQG